MQSEILLKLVTVLTPDDVRRMKAAGLGDLAKGFIERLDELATEWRSVACGEFWDRKVWAEVWVKLRELRAVLREG